jgi:Protein of unknown function (DUF2934)
MARKRNLETDLIVSASGGSAPARRKGTTRTRTQRSTDVVDAPAIPAVQPESDSPASAGEPSRAAIAALAYSYWEARGCQGGSPEEDWLRAEEELRGHFVSATA